jgi:hypothetical protein
MCSGQVMQRRCMSNPHRGGAPDHPGALGAPGVVGVTAEDTVAVDDIHPSFGADIFSSAPGDGGGAAHSQYWGPGDPSRPKIASIVTGHYVDVS